MRNRVLSIAKNLSASQFLTGSLIMLIGSNLHNFGQLVFHFVAGRLLGTEYYGDVASLINVLGIVAIVQLSLGLTIVKFISSGEQEKDIARFCRWIFYWSLWIGGILGFLFLILSPFLADFLKIHQRNAIYLVGPLVFLFMVANIGRSILQGLLKFNSYVISMIAEVFIKTALAIPLIMAGYATFGVLIAMLVGVLVAIIIIRTSFRSYLDGPRGERPNIKPFLKYSFPVFIQGLSLTSMYSTDLLLVKHFFQPGDAGVYAALAKLGSIVFFGASPIASVMFPLVSKRYAKSEPYKNLFYMSISFVAITAVAIIVLYKLVPELILGLLYGEQYLPGANLLWWFGGFMGLLAICSLFTQFYLSIGKTVAVWFFAAASLLQAILIWFFHSSLLQVIQISISSAALLALALFVYFLYLENKK